MQILSPLRSARLRICGGGGGKSAGLSARGLGNQHGFASDHLGQKLAERNINKTPYTHIIYVYIYNIYIYIYIYTLSLSIYMYTHTYIYIYMPFGGQNPIGFLQSLVFERDPGPAHAGTESTGLASPFLADVVLMDSDAPGHSMHLI